MKLSIRDLNETELKKVNNPEHPCIALTLIDQTNSTEITLSYLYLMRGYAFQIGGLNADGCNSVTTVIGFGNIIHAFNDYTAPHVNNTSYASNVPVMSENDNSIVMELFNGQAVACVMQLIQRYTDKEWLKERIGAAGLEMAITEVDNSIGKCFKRYGCKDNVWQKFIRNSVNYMLEVYNQNI